MIFKLIYTFLFGAVFGYIAQFDLIWIKAIFAIAVTLIFVEYKVYKERFK